MWAKRTKEEYEQYCKEDENINKKQFKKLFSIKGIIILFLFFTVLLIVLELLFGESIGARLPIDLRNKIRFSDIPNRLPYYFTVSFFLVICIYALTKILKHRLHPNTFICEKCNKLKSYDGNLQCECGGKYINIDEMKWVENQEDSKT